MSKTVPVIKRTGIIFRPGDYSDTPCGIVTEDDMDAIAAASNVAVPVKSEHGDSLFDEKMGVVSNFRVAPDAQGVKVVWGDWEEPEPLAQFLGDVRRRISAGFNDWRTRQINEISLVKFPRVADAAFFSGLKAAFSAYESGGEVQPLQAAPVEFGYHTVEERDAIAIDEFADQQNKLFPIRTQDELYDAQRQIWHAADPTTVKANIVAIAERKKLKLGEFYPYSERGVSKPLTDDSAETDYYFSAAEPHTLDKKTNAVYNEVRTNSRRASEDNKTMSEAIANANEVPQDVTPSGWEKIKAALGLTHEQVATAQANFSKSPRELELEREVAAMKAAQFSSGQQSRAAASKAAAQKLAHEKRIMPAEVERVAAEFSRAMDDDAREPAPVKFSVEKDGQPQEVEMSRAQLLEAHYAARPPHKRDQETVSSLPEGAMAMFSNEQTKLRGEDNSANFNSKEYIAEMVAAGMPHEKAVAMAAQYN